MPIVEIERVFGCLEVDIAFSEYKKLDQDGLVKLGIDHKVADTLIADNFGPSAKGVAASNIFYLLVSVAVIVGSVYLSFTYAWWAFIPGVALGLYSHRKTLGSHAKKCVAKGHHDPDFYGAVKDRGGWLYKMKEEVAEQFHI